MSHNIELKCAFDIKYGVSQLSLVLPNIRKLISPALQIAYHMQNSVGNINFNAVITSEVGIWQSEVCVNASTQIFHTERDVTYTFIMVPKKIVKFKAIAREKMVNATGKKMNTTGKKPASYLN